jgi:alkylation response protein AidB-like acyl-CoA dehydrogenase
VTFDDTAEQAQLRAELRAWAQENAAGAPPRTTFQPYNDETVAQWRRWQARLAEAGWGAVSWPVEYGGRGLTAVETAIVAEELEAARLPGVFDFIGVEMVAPTLIACGTAEQCASYLPPMLRADDVWCQLFSEPAGGSDLAAVRTRASRRDDGSWLIQGQKVWSSHAQHASFGLLVARTGSPESRHRGLAAFIVPMDAPGVSVRPIRMISGDAEINEVFLDDVVLSPHSVIGEVDGGWAVALTMLGFERYSVASGHHTASLEELTDAVAKSGELGDATRQRLGSIGAELLGMRYLGQRIVRSLTPGMVPGPEAALAKITSVAASFDAAGLAVDVLGLDALAGTWGQQISGFPGVRSAGGSEEILRNVVGERLLGLAPEPRGV